MSLSISFAVTFIEDLISRLNEMNIMVTDLPQAKQQQI
jgi:hypothetical protein